jgi:hypothetical protein
VGPDEVAFLPQDALPFTGRLALASAAVGREWAAERDIGEAPSTVYLILELGAGRVASLMLADDYGDDLDCVEHHV